MIKKIVFVFALFVVSSTSVFAQPCNILVSDSAGLVWPPVDSLPCIEQGSAYSQAMQISMPGAFHGVVTIDSVVLTSITGLPSGITYAMNPSNGVFYGNQNGCVAFTGTTNDNEGTYLLTFNGYAVVTSSGAGTQTYSLAQLSQIEGAPVPVYALEVIAAGDTCRPIYINTGIKPLAQNYTLNVFPNPTKGNFEVTFEADNNVNGELTVTDVVGKTVYSQTISNVSFYRTSINASNFTRGLYLVELKTSSGVVSKKISVE